ncbi:hypothetical protein ACIRQP_15935 [Streptomyces sp. NPDC102274]|uniref:hypothetical protein n=1 Tax=Streptomyces sp. NPDC102274 TaxID=3366151 RepID=UPI00380231B6
MPEHRMTVRDVAALRVTRVGRVEKCDDPLRLFRLVDADGTEVAAGTVSVGVSVGDIR